MVLSSSPAKQSRGRHVFAKRLLFFSLEDWNHIWRRNQFFCAELLRRHEDLEILWVSPVVDIPYSILRGRFGEVGSLQTTPQPVPGRERVWTLKPFKILPGRVGTQFNHWTFRSHIQSALRRLGWDSFDIWINAHGARNLLPLDGGQKLIYDITDDWTKLKHPPHLLQRLTEDDAALLQQSDHVIVCSQNLLESKQDRCRKISLISNGVDAERYHPAALAKLDPPKDMAHITGPIVGYTGTLHSERLDLDMLDSVFSELRSVNFVFVGPNIMPAGDLMRLNKPNVHVLGEKSYCELPRYVSRFDVCMTPHLVNGFTESLDPLKLYEYMSTGKPIVSTRCAVFRDLMNLVNLAGRTDFAASLKRAINDDDPSSRDARIAWATNHSWSKRVDDVDSILGWN